MTNGYPDEDELKALKNLDPMDFDAGARLLCNLFTESGYGRAEYSRGKLTLITGGWSGCEEMIEAINWIWRSLYWESSHRGGKHVYKRMRR